MAYQPDNARSSKSQPKVAQLLSDMARDPAVVAFFRRGERDSGAAYAVPFQPKPTLTGGALLEIA